MIVFLRISIDPGFRPENRSCCRANPRLLLLLALLISGVHPAHAQTKSTSPASLIYEHCHSSVVVVFTLDKDNKLLAWLIHQRRES